MRSMDYTRLRIVELDGSESFATGDDELIVLPLAGGGGGAVRDRHFTLHGRESVSAAVPASAYAPIGAHVTLPGKGRIALPAAKASKRLEPRYGPAEDVPVE